MIIYEFYLKDAVEAQAVDMLCASFYALGKVGKPRKVDGVDGPAVYVISCHVQPPDPTYWVQLLVDDDTPASIITAIEATINGLCDTTYTKTTSDKHTIAPMERKRTEIGI